MLAFGWVYPAVLVVGLSGGQAKTRPAPVDDDAEAPRPSRSRMLEAEDDADADDDTPARAAVPGKKAPAVDPELLARFTRRALQVREQGKTMVVVRDGKVLTEQELYDAGAPDVSDYDPSAGKPKVPWQVPLSATPLVCLCPLGAGLAWCVVGGVVGVALGGLWGVVYGAMFGLLYGSAALAFFGAVIGLFAGALYGLFFGVGSCLWPGVLVGGIVFTMGGLMSNLGILGAYALKTQRDAAPAHPYVGFVHEFNTALARELRIKKSALDRKYFPR